MTRHWWVRIRRYAGLTMTLFFRHPGLKGRVLAFYHELVTRDGRHYRGYFPELRLICPDPEN